MSNFKNWEEEAQSVFEVHIDKLFALVLPNAVDNTAVVLQKWNFVLRTKNL